MANEPVRSFIAIELPEAVRGELGQLQARLKAAGLPSVKWVDPLGIHLTLKFLGSVRATQLDQITAAIEAAAEGISPFKLELRGLGVFPNPRQVRVIWVGLMGELDRLKELQQRLDARLNDLGFTPESRPFTAHLTLARVREQATPQEREHIGQLVTQTPFEFAEPIEVNSVSLMRSQLTRQGAVYSQIASVLLK